MKFLKDRVKLLQSEMRDPKTRRAVFREAGKTYTKWKDELTDRPGAIARLMEMAFDAGMAHSRESSLSPEVKAVAISARMRDIDVPSLSREILEDFRRYKIGARVDGAFPILEQYAFFCERGSGVPGRSGRDRWFEYGSRSDRSRSTKAIGPLVKLGLFEETALAISGVTEMRGVIITEWGVEILLTGATEKPGFRQDSNSTTYSTYLALKEHRSLPQEIGIITVWDLHSSVAAFVVDHRVGGVGRPERLEGGACIEDIAYFLEVLEHPSVRRPIKRWRLYRSNPALMPLIGGLERELVDAGILLIEDAGQMLISEWGYELICTGKTTAQNGRITSKSSTYQEYYHILNNHIK